MITQSTQDLGQDRTPQGTQTKTDDTAALQQQAETTNQENIETRQTQVKKDEIDPIDDEDE